MSDEIETAALRTIIGLMQKRMANDYLQRLKKKPGAKGSAGAEEPQAVQETEEKTE